MDTKMPKEVHNALTPTKVKQEKVPGRYADGAGLYLVVSETGARWWQWRGTVHGRRREIGMGSARLISLVDAREFARSWRWIARAGGDPAVERDKGKRESLTFEAAARRVWAEQIEPPGRNKQYTKQWLSSLEIYAIPVIGSLPVHAVTQSDILRVLSPIWADKPQTARLIRQRLRIVLNWSRTAGHCEGINPVDGVEDGLPKQRHRVKHFKALPINELPDLMRRLDAVKGVAALALRFVILTAARSGEVRSMTWGDVDINNAIWTVPAERMKAGLPHRVPISEPAQKALCAVRGLDSQLVFPGQKSGRPMHDLTISAPLKRMGVVCTVHGFRSTFRDWAAERTSFPREIAEMCLAHEVGNAVERAYRRSDLYDKCRDLMGQWGRFCCPASADEATGKSARPPFNR
jgi:integrase